MNKSYAECYSKHRSESDGQSIVIAEIIKRYLGDISLVSILDIGSGAGRLAIPLGAKSGKYVCIESDTVSVEFLKNKAKNSNVELEIHNSNFQDISKESLGQFDLVLLSHVIHWFNLEFLIQKTSTFIKPGGMILISYFAKNDLAKMLFYQVSGKEILEIQQDITPSIMQIKRVLLSAGLEIIETANVPLSVDYGNDKLLNIIRSSGTLAWQQASMALSKDDFQKIQNSALKRLEHYDHLIDKEYRTMLLATPKI